LPRPAKRSSAAAVAPTAVVGASPEEGVEILEQVLRLRPDDVRARLAIAVAYARTRRIERAFEHLERALELDPAGFAPRCALGELYLRLGTPLQAREHLCRALERATKPAERAYVRRLLKEDRRSLARGPVGQV
jgi:tetratricopeptide (TPR) repeat protein